MNFVGREAVEQIQTAMGHSQPSENVPMLTTRDLTILEVSGDARIEGVFAEEVPTDPESSASNTVDT